MAKLQRWIDLLAALLRRNAPASLEELKQDVPAYLKSPNLTALRRTFERDKEELRAFGIPITTEEDGAGEVMGYRLRREGFYLPYLSLVQGGRPRSKPRRVNRYGYLSLASLDFAPDELDAIVSAARRVQALGDVNLDELSRSAMRKLAMDLPVDLSVRESIATVYAPAAQLGEVLSVLDRGLRQRKRITIDYHSMASDRSARRVVEPHGLFFMGSHWYLAAREEEGPVKNFRVSRIASAEVNARQPGTPDYEIAPSFDLEAHARSRHAWELGDTAAEEAIVEARGRSGPAQAALKLGEAVDGHANRRRFQVRRSDAFARWLLSFGGDLVPVSPEGLVAEYRALATRTLEVYA